MGPSVTRAVLSADNIDVPTAAARGWIGSAVELARSLGRHPATAYAAMKQQLHRHARAAIDAGEELDAKVRAVWKSAETRGAISAFLDALN
jgi:enoyl-CoA hydratase